ncbi:MAG TPA: hypothetical protein VK816_04465 [Jatrophihabitantaceae bacterium]|nr:hypothetical protein [Jatrophihabitantaceae bacterium]
MQAEPPLTALAEGLVGARIVIAPGVTAVVVKSAQRSRPDLLGLDLDVHAHDAREQWTIEMTFSADDVNLLADANNIATYQQVVAANIAEWWHTRVSTTITRASRRT